MAMGYSDVMPLSMLQHVQVNLDEYRGAGKKSKRSAGEEYEEKVNAGWCFVFWRRPRLHVYDICGAGDEESEIRAQVKQWEENTDVYDLTRQAIDMYMSNVR